MQRIKVLLTMLGLIASFAHFPAAAQSPQMVWNLEEIIRSNDDPVLLRNSRGTLVRRLDATVPRFIYVVAQDIMHAAETRADLFITTGNQPNAAAGVGNGRNTVLINLGMIDMVGDDMNQWAALLGHEIAHITLGHHGEAQVRRGALMVLEAISYAGLGSGLERQAAGLAFQAFETKYSRDAERESDYLGVIWAIEAGYDPRGAAQLHRKFQARSSGHPVPFLSSHPTSAERIATLERLARDLARSESPPEP